MSKLHSFGWYAARISPHLPEEAFKPVPLRLLGGLAFLLIIVAGMLTISFIDLNFWLSIVISIVIGASFASMGFLGHEILHGTVVKKPWLRDFLGAITFWPLCTGPSLWRKWHNMNHHVHTQHDDLDPDSWPSLQKVSQLPVIRLMYRFPQSLRSLASFSFLSVMFTMHSLRMFKVYLKQFKPQSRPKVWLQLILPWATWVGLLFVIGFTNWLFAFLIPLLIANFIVMCYISTNHRLNPLVEVNDPLANSLTVTVPKWVDVIHFNFSYHTEHHLFPTMNPKYYPLVKKHIKQMWPERYHEMPLLKALKALWMTPRVYYKETEFVDMHRDKAYSSLGHGLDPDNIESKKANIKEEDKIVVARPKNSASN